jgi:hypothetical protein
MVSYWNAVQQCGDRIARRERKRFGQSSLSRFARFGERRHGLRPEEHDIVQASERDVGMFDQLADTIWWEIYK